MVLALFPVETRVLGVRPVHVAEDNQPPSDTVTRPKRGTSRESIIRFVLACFLVGIHLSVRTCSYVYRFQSLCALVVAKICCAVGAIGALGASLLFCCLDSA